MRRTVSCCLGAGAAHAGRCADARGRCFATTARLRRIEAVALARRVLGPLARPITRLEPTRAPASELACAPAAQPPPRYDF